MFDIHQEVDVAFRGLLAARERAEHGQPLEFIFVAQDIAVLAKSYSYLPQILHRRNGSRRIDRCRGIDRGRFCSERQVIAGDLQGIRGGSNALQTRVAVAGSLPAGDLLLGGSELFGKLALRDAEGTSLGG